MHIASSEGKEPVLKRESAYIAFLVRLYNWWGGGKERNDCPVFKSRKGYYIIRISLLRG